MVVKENFYKDRLDDMAESFKKLGQGFYPEDDNSESDRHAKATSLNIARLVLNEDPNESHGSETLAQHHSKESSNRLDKK